MTIKTWSDVQAQISLHKLPYSVLRFNMSLSGVMIDTATGDTLACTIRDAAHVIQGAAASPSTLTDDDGGRTRIGNTPTCEDCEQPLDSCTCGDDESPAEHTQDSDCTPAPKPLGLQMADDIVKALMPKRSTSISLSPAEVLAADLMGKQAKAARGVNGFDYKHQAWVKDGKYLRCGHDPMMAGCTCYGRLHEGEPVGVDADIQ